MASKKKRSNNKKKIKSDPLFNLLFKAALPYLQRAHSPYSHVQVASSVLMNDGMIYSGCNIENASYGGTICAERVAITKAVSEGSKKIRAILVVTNQKSIWPPCGFCRQVIAEFASASAVVYMCDKKMNFKKLSFKKLFPSHFDSHFLAK